MICVGCSGDATQGLESLVPTCAACWRAFMDVFDRPAPAVGLVVDEGPASRVADAILVSLGERPPAPGPRPIVLLPVPNRAPRRGRL